MTQQATITQAFDTLRELCDPRGHPLLGALESLCRVNDQALDYVLSVSPVVPVKDVVAAIEEYGWSKKVEI